MQRRPLILVALSLCAVATSLQCEPGKSHPPARTTPSRAAAEPRAHRPAGPPPKAPTGPAIDQHLLVTAQIGPTDRLDARLAALAPPMMPKPLVGSLFSKQMLPELAKDLGLNPLALDALDLTRPAVIGLLITRATNHKDEPDVKAVALLPVRNATKLVVDALKVSWPESVITGWGGVQLVLGGRTKAWVRVYDRWVVVAPTAPLLDSAYRALPGLARGVPEGTVKVHVRYAEILDIVRPAILKGWKELKRMASMLGPRLGVTEGLIAQLMPLAEKIAGYLDSIGKVDLNLRIADAAWSGGVKVTPKPGGPLATWIKGLTPPKGFGLSVLPPNPILAATDHQSEDLRLLTVRLLGGVVDFVWPKLVHELPRPVKQRGLLDRKRPVSLLQYRRKLRDLNLRDYKESYGLYRLLFEVRALRKHLEARMPPLIKLSTGLTAAALYAPNGPGLSVVTVERVKDVVKHRRAMYALMFGNQRLLNRLIAGIWKVVPRKEKARYNLYRAPLRVVWNPLAMRVGRTSVSSMAFRMRWPKKPAGKTPRWYTEMKKVRQIVELLLGKGDLTYAWGYAGKRLVVVMGKNWRSQMKAALTRTTRAGAKLPNASTDPLIKRTLAAAQGTVLSSTVLSGARLVQAVLAALQAVGVPLPTGGPAAMFLNYLRQEAAAARSGTLLTQSRQGGTYRLAVRIPASDLKTLLVGLGYGLFAVRSKSGPRKSPGVAPSTSTPATPPSP